MQDPPVQPDHSQELVRDESADLAQTMSWMPETAGAVASDRDDQAGSAKLHGGLLRTGWNWWQAAEFVAALADLLAPWHASGGYHGGISPEVISRGEDGKPLLAGVAVESSGSPAAVATLGPCTAPEQLSSGGKAGDSRCDVYALGVVLYLLLCSRYPFRALNAVELRRQIEEDAPQPPRQLVYSIPPELERICLTMLSKKPSLRPRDGGELGRALREVLSATETANPSLVAPSRGSASRSGPAADGGELLLLIQWLADGQASRLKMVLRDCVERRGGRIVGECDTFSAVQLPALSTGMTDLATALHFALATLCEISEREGAVPFAVYTAKSRTGAEEVALGNNDWIWSRFERVALRLEGVVRGSLFELAPVSCAMLRRWLTVTPTAGSSETWEIFLEEREVSGAPLSRRYRVTVGVSKATACRTEAPLTGRKAQLGVLESRWQHARQGLGQFVLLIGEEGAGKSRLISAWRQQMQADSEQPHWIIWKCQPRQRGVGLHPATEFLRGILSAPGDGELALVELASYLARWEVGTPENVAALASLLELPAAYSEEPARLRREIEALTVAQRWERCRRVVLEWLQRVSRDAPAALVVEDLQWVDPVTLALLQELVDRGPRERMLTVLSFRPEFETPWGSRSYQTQVALSRLTRSQAATIHAHVTGVVSPNQETLVRMMAVSGGNPLSVEAFALLDLATVGRAERRGPGESQDLPAAPS